MSRERTQWEFFFAISVELHEVGQALLKKRNCKKRSVLKSEDVLKNTLHIIKSNPRYSLRQQAKSYPPRSPEFRKWKFYVYDLLTDTWDVRSDACHYRDNFFFKQGIRTKKGYKEIFF